MSTMDSTNAPEQARAMGCDGCHYWQHEARAAQAQAGRLRAMITAYIQAAEYAYALDQTRFPDDERQAAFDKAQDAYDVLAKEAGNESQ